MDKSTRDFLLFLLKLLVIWLSWKAFVFIIGEENTPADKLLFPALNYKWEIFNGWYKVHLLKICIVLLKTLGEPAWLEKVNRISIGDLGGVTVGNYCLGFQLMYYFTMVVAVSKLRLSQKAYGIAVGFLLVNVLSVIRLSGLAYISAYHYHLSYFFHDYVFNIIVFGSLMVFYYWLVKRN